MALAGGGSLYGIIIPSVAVQQPSLPSVDMSLVLPSHERRLEMVTQVEARRIVGIVAASLAGVGLVIVILTLLYASWKNRSQARKVVPLPYVRADLRREEGEGLVAPSSWQAPSPPDVESVVNSRAATSAMPSPTPRPRLMLPANQAQTAEAGPREPPLADGSIESRGHMSGTEIRKPDRSNVSPKDGGGIVFPVLLDSAGQQSRTDDLPQPPAPPLPSRYRTHKSKGRKPQVPPIPTEWSVAALNDATAASRPAPRKAEEESLVFHSPTRGTRSNVANEPRSPSPSRVPATPSGMTVQENSSAGLASPAWRSPSIETQDSSAAGRATPAWLPPDSPAAGSVVYEVTSISASTSPATSPLGQLRSRGLSADGGDRKVPVLYS